MRARIPLLAASVILGTFLSGSAVAQPLTLDMKGGGLGQLTNVEVAGPAGSNYLLLISLVFSPTPLPPPHVSPIDVGLELASLSTQIFLRSIPGSGVDPFVLPIPNDPALDGLNINFQALRIQGSFFAEKSNPWRLTFEAPAGIAPTLNDLLQARAFATSTPLANGTVLVAGGGVGTLTSATGLASAELYHPNLEAFVATGSMNNARALHRATRLADGRVLITGGVDGTGVTTNTAEIYNPVTGTFTSTGSMNTARVGHQASLLPDGRVLVTGGSANLATADVFISSAQSSTEIFNPVTGTFSGGPSLARPHTFHDAIALNDGRVLMSGGVTFVSLFGLPVPSISDHSQLYTQNSGSGTFAGEVDMGTERAAHTSVVLADGRLLIVGGASGNVLAPVMETSTRLFNPANGSFAAGPSLTVGRALAGLVLLPDGRVHISGGATGDLINPVALGTCEIYTPGGAGTLAASTAMLTTRLGHGVVLLSDLTVALIAGGGGPSGSAALSTAEIFQP